MTHSPATCSVCLAREGVPDIIEFIKSPCFLGPDEDISVAQVSVLKAIYGLSMSEEEERVFLQLTDGRKARSGGYSEAWIIVGRRSGKTDKILANCAVFEAFTFDGSSLADGEEAFYPIVAQNVDGANRARSYIEGKLLKLEERGWEILDHGSAQSRAITGKEIRTTMGVTFRCFPCTKAAVRGITAIGAATDESAWWCTEENGCNADREVFRALRPTVATFGRRAKRLNATSPYAEEGAVWDAWEKRHTSQALVINAPSWVFNPNLPQDFLDNERMNDLSAYLREYGAQFGKEGGSYLDPSEIERAIDKSRPLIVPYEPGHDYRAALDVAFKGDLYVLAIGWMDASGIVNFNVWTWKGSKKAPLDGEVIAEEAAGYLKVFGIDQLPTDQYSDEQVKKDYAKFGITVLIEPDSEALNWEMYKNLKAAMRRGLCCFADDPVIRKDLGSLRRVGGGRVPKICAPQRGGFHDDVSKASSKVLMKILPSSGNLDLAEVNRKAMPERRLDWREQDDKEEFGGNLMEAIY